MSIVKEEFFFFLCSTIITHWWKKPLYLRLILPASHIFISMTKSDCKLQYICCNHAFQPSSLSFLLSDSFFLSCFLFLCWKLYQVCLPLWLFLRHMPHTRQQSEVFLSEQCLFSGRTALFFYVFFSFVFCNRFSRHSTSWLGLHPPCLFCSFLSVSKNQIFFPPACVWKGQLFFTDENYCNCKDEWC